MSPSYTASTMSSAARSRTSIALWPAVGKLDEHRIGNQRHDSSATDRGVIRSRPPEMTTVGQVKLGISAARS